MNTFIATAKDKKLVFGSDYHRAAFMEFLAYCEAENKKIRIDLAKNPVSDEMRGYYFAVVLPTLRSAIPEWKLMTDDDVHEMAKKAWNSFDCFNPVTKRVERYGRSAMSDGSNTKRAMEYIEKIRLYLLENYQIELASPDEYKVIRDSAPLKGE